MCEAVYKKRIFKNIFAYSARATILKSEYVGKRRLNSEARQEVYLFSS
jgi:hypothetical protein